MPTCLPRSMSSSLASDVTAMMGRWRIAGVFLTFDANSNPFEVRHFQIGHDQVADLPGMAQHVPGDLPVLASQHLVTVVLEEAGQLLAEEARVLGQQDGRAHRLGGCPRQGRARRRPSRGGRRGSIRSGPAAASPCRRAPASRSRPARGRSKRRYRSIPGGYPSVGRDQADLALADAEHHHVEPRLAAAAAAALTCFSRLSSGREAPRY